MRIYKRSGNPQRLQIQLWVNGASTGIILGEVNGNGVVNGAILTDNRDDHNIKLNAGARIELRVLRPDGDNGNRDWDDLIVQLFVKELLPT